MPLIFQLLLASVYKDLAIRAKLKNNNSRKMARPKDEEKTAASLVSDLAL